MPRLSIICPTFNRSNLLRQCVQSVLCCESVSIQMIIVDDGSTDDTPSVSHELQKAYGEECIVVSRSEENLGAQAARNRGLPLATGEFAMFVDSDDVVVPGGVARLIERLQEDPTLDYVYGKVIRTDEQLKPLPGNSTVGEPFSEAAVELAGYHWCTTGAVYRKKYLEKVGPWNEALTGSQDWEYQARVKLAGGRGEFVDTLVGYWRQHDLGRVGTNRFRPDYVQSVMLATASILRRSREAERCDDALERRLAGKLIAHALEFGANGFATERYDCLSQAAACITHQRFLRMAVKLLRLTPSFADGRLWQLLVARRLNGRDSKSS